MTNHIQRILGYKFCEEHQQEYLQFCSACAINNAQQLHPSPDLESVRRMIETAEHIAAFKDVPIPDREWVDAMNRMASCCVAAEGAIPTLRSLLAEVERSRTLHKELDTVSGRYGEATQEIVRLKLDLAAAQATITELKKLVWMIPPEEAGEKSHKEIQIEVAKKLCLELLALKGNSFEINQLAEKIHYALS